MGPWEGFRFEDWVESLQLPNSYPNTSAKGRFNVTYASGEAERGHGSIYSDGSAPGGATQVRLRTRAAFQSVSGDLAKTVQDEVDVETVELGRFSWRWPRWCWWWWWVQPVPPEF